MAAKPLEMNSCFDFTVPNCPWIQRGRRQNWHFSRYSSPIWPVRKIMARTTWSPCHMKSCHMKSMSYGVHVIWTDHNRIRESKPNLQERQPVSDFLQINRIKYLITQILSRIANKLSRCDWKKWKWKDCVWKIIRVLRKWLLPEAKTKVNLVHPLIDDFWTFFLLQKITFANSRSFASWASSGTMTARFSDQKRAFCWILRINSVLKALTSRKFADFGRIDIANSLWFQLNRIV